MRIFVSLAVVALLFGALCFPATSVAYGPAAIDTRPPRPTDTPMPAAPTPPAPAPDTGLAFIELTAAGGGWAGVQWQDSAGRWLDVTGWQGALDASGRQQWVVLPANWGARGYRWRAFDRANGALLAVSETFDLPAAQGQTTRLTLTIKPGAAPLPSATPAPAAPELLAVVVARGDTLLTYVRRYGVSASAIMAANPSVSANRGWLLAGQTLYIPTAASTGYVDTSGLLRVTVLKGETLATFMARYGVSAAAILRVNPALRANPSLIYAGQTIVIPVAAGGGASTGARQYTVQPGDDLRAIASKFGVTVRAILNSNYIPNPDVIYAGQVLSIPAP